MALSGLECKESKYFVVFKGILSLICFLKNYVLFPDETIRES